MVSSPTGPFDKYLYSSAFYFQAANSYRLILKWLENSEPEQRDILVNLIRESWLRAVMNTYSPAFSGTGMDGSIGLYNHRKIKNLLEAVSCLVQGMISEAIEQVSSQPKGSMTLQIFFEIWTEVCAKAHAELIGSEEFIDGMTEMINRSIRSTVEAFANMECKHE